jgi:transposase
MISECKVTQRVYQRLIFLKCLKQGANIKEASGSISVGRHTGSRWLKSLQ